MRRNYGKSKASIAFVSYNYMTEKWYRDVDGKSEEITDTSEIEKLEHERIYGAYERSYY